MDLPDQHHAAPLQIIRDSSGIVVGRLEKQSLTGKIIARDAHGVIVGRFDEREGLTRDVSGRVIARGNVLPTLVMGR